MVMRGASGDALDELSGKLGTSGTLAEIATTGEELFGIAGVLRAEPALRRVATDSSVEGDAKAGLVGGIFKASLGAKALSLVTDAVRLRWTSSHDLPDAFEELAVVALVRSAGAKGNQVGDELFQVTQLVAANPELRAALSDPTRSTKDRSALLASLLDGRTLPATARLVEQAVVAGQSTIESVLAQYQKLAASALDEIVAVVHTARTLSEKDLERLTGALAKQYATSVHLHVVVDPDLVGGLRVEIGDDVIDGTVSNRLDEARRRLAG